MWGSPHDTPVRSQHGDTSRRSQMSARTSAGGIRLADSYRLQVLRPIPRTCTQSSMVHPSPPYNSLIFLRRRPSASASKFFA